jgi:hypothetical protein
MPSEKRLKAEAGAELVKGHAVSRRIADRCMIDRLVDERLIDLPRNWRLDDPIVQSLIADWRSISPREKAARKAKARALLVVARLDELIARGVDSFGLSPQGKDPR